MLEAKVEQIEDDLHEQKKTNREISAKLDKIILENAVGKAGLSKRDKAVLYGGMFGSILIAATEIIVHLVI